MTSVTAVSRLFGAEIEAIVIRLPGVLLAALAVQLVMDGIVQTLR